MKRWIALIAVLAAMAWAMAPHAAYTEDRDTVLLARAIYALAREDSYEAKLAIGSLAMNRLENPWFANSLGEVLNEQHQFPIGRRYDAECLSAAHDVLSGRRVLSPDSVYYQSAAASCPRADSPLETVGTFAFYASDSEF